MHTFKSKYLVAPLILAVAAIILVSVPYIAKANPFYTGSKAETATATTTVTYMTPGTSTTTPIYDSYEQYGSHQSNSGNLTLPDSVAVGLQGAASSSATVLSATCEFSDNYNGTTGAGDWFQNEINTGTTTNSVDITSPVSFSFKYSSSTNDIGGQALSATYGNFQKVFECPVPTRYVRAVITITGANGSVWAEIIPKKQRNSGN